LDLSGSEKMLDILKELLRLITVNYQPFKELINLKLRGQISVLDISPNNTVLNLR
jgi:hypothetical protein